MPSTGIEIKLIEALGKQLTNRSASALLDFAFDAAQSLFGIHKDTDSTEKQVRKLIKKYYKKGKECLKYARDSDSDSDRRSYLKDAISEFTDAAELDSEDIVLSSKMLIATCFQLLNDETNAEKRLAEAYSYLYNNFFEIASARGSITAENSGVDHNTIGTFNQSNDLELIEIYTDEAKDLYRELHDAASTLEEKGYEVKIPSKENTVGTVRDYYKRIADASYQRSRGM